MRLPPVNLDHLERLTDANGIVQFAPLGLPDPSTGYPIDDNARALIVTSRLPRGQLREHLTGIYLDCLRRAQRPDGTIAHETAADRSLSLKPASEDAVGRLIWACGEIASSDLPETMKQAAASILQAARPHIAGMHHVRGWSNAAQGLALWAYHSGDSWAYEATVECAEHISDLLDARSDPEWMWFEDVMTYEPGRPSLGLLHAAALTGEVRYLDAAERILGFLERKLFEVTPRRRIFTPAGNRGWYRRDGTRAVFDQQPIDAASLVEAATAAGVLTSDPRYRSVARDAFEWFLGANVAGTALYDPETGACCDGLTPHGVNLNAGAESTICYLIARVTVAARTIPISRLLAARAPALELRDARRAGYARAPQERPSRPERPTAEPRPVTPSRR